MAGYDLEVHVEADFDIEARAFFEFLRNVGRKYPVRIRYRTISPGRYYLVIDGTPGANIDALFQELILNRGLYYYVCSLKSSRKRSIVSSVIAPIYAQLLESRFPNSYRRFLRRHISGRLPQNDFVPGELHNEFCHEYEVLFRRWDLKMVDDWNFVKDADSLVNRFMLKQLGHTPGNRSPNFHSLLEQSYAKGLAMEEETKVIFTRLHMARTEGLHRLASNLSHDEVSELASQLYFYFSYFDEFDASQALKTLKLNGKRYKRVKYGDEERAVEFGESGSRTLSAVPLQPCHDCAAVIGQYHCEGCDWERCPRCGGQLLGCECGKDGDEDAA